MSEDRCPACGGPLPPAARRSCLVCGATRSGVPPASGAATMFQPQLIADEVFTRLLEEGSPALSAETVGVRGPEGTRLIPADELSPPPVVEPPVRGQLRLHDGNGGGRLFQLRRRTEVGRNGAVAVEDETLSSRHFEIERSEGQFVLRDLESSNGTFLNGQRVERAELQSGDEIRAGRSVFTFSVVAAVTTP